MVMAHADPKAICNIMKADLVIIIQKMRARFNKEQAVLIKKLDAGKELTFEQDDRTNELDAMIDLTYTFEEKVNAIKCPK